MKRLKKLWSLSAIIGMMISLFPMSAIAETADQTGVVVNQVTVTDTNDQEITENHRIDQKTAVKLNLGWALAQPTLIEENTTTIIELPTNLHYLDQSGSLGEMGNYQVKNQQLIFQFKQNYQKTADGLVPDFASAKFYEGLIEVTAETTSENVEAETIDFGNNVLTSIYYNKASDPTADIVNQAEADQTIAKRQARADHEANLNARGVNLFTNIKITDFNDQEFNEENPAIQDANIKIHFDWVLDDAEIIQDGDFYTYQLPDYFSIHNAVTDVLKNQDGDVLGSFTLDLNGLLTVTFNDKAGNLSERQGTIDLRTELKITTENETIEISTGITDEAGVEIRIVIPVVKADISKSGKIEADNSVTWTIILNEERRDLRNAVLRDTMPEGLSVWYTQDYVMNENGEWVIPPAGFINSWIAGTDYVYKFTSGVMNQPVKIVLKMRMDDESKKEFLNKATISGDNFISNSAEASVSFDERDNYKYCTDYDLNTGIFNWEIKATYTTDGGILKDWMYSRYGDPNTAKHYLLKDSIKVYDENGNEVASDKWSFSEAAADYREKNGEYVHFTLNFAEKGVYKVKYSTQTFDVPTPLRSALQNTALIIDGTESEEINAGETPDVEGALGITKTAPSKNYATNTISWQVVLNKNRLLMKDAIIKDRYTTLSGINKSALQLIESSLVVKANDGTTDKVLTKDSDYVLEKVDGDEDYSLGFNIRLIGAYATTSDQITFNYDTHFFMDKQPHHDTGTTQRFDNSVVVTYTGEDGKNHTDGAELATWVSAQYAFNGFKYGKYLTEGADVAKAFSHNNPFAETTAGENSVYWTALFNTWKTTIPKETTIKEALGEGQTLKELVIYDVNVAASKLEAAQLGTKWEVNVDYTYELDEAGVPTITLLKDKESTFAIFVSAEAADEVPTYKNVATMTVKDSKPIKVEGTVEKSAKDAWISKSGQQGTGEDYRSINWSVVLNKDGHTIHDPVVKDTVKISEQTFVYDADKNVVVKVFKAKNNGSGTFVKDGEALVFTEENSPVVTSDSAAGTQTLTIHLGETIDSAYIIEYQTLLDPGIQNNEVIANEASLYGKDIQFHEVTKTVTVKSTDGEGTSSGKNGSITFRKLDENDQLNKYIGYKNPGTVIDSLYAENPTHILYDTWDGGGDDYWLYLKNITAGIPWRDPRQRFEITTKAVSNVMFVVHNNDVTPSSIVYFTDFLAKPEFSPAYAVDSSFENANRDVCLKAKQTIPNVDQWQKSTQMAINVNMEQVNRTQQYTFDKVIVTNFNGEDLTDLFSSQADDKNVQIVAKNPSDSRLYDTILQYKVCLKWIGAKNPVDTAIVSDGKLHLPFKVETILDGDHLEENAASSIVNYLGKETTAFLNEQDTLLHDSITKAGILTTSFDLSDDYPEIPGYEPIKDEKQDKGIFLPEEQTIIHRYREKKKLQFELTDMENPLFISRFTNKRELAFAFTHDKTTNISLMAQCGAEVKELKKYTDAPESVVDRLVFEFPENWLDQEVSFYIKDDNNQESEKESRFIKKESSPKLIIPDTISFGENEIPAMDRVISATTKEEFGVEDESKLDKSHWKIKVKEEQPLTNEKGQVLAQRLSYKNQKQEVPINGDNQPILEGSGSTKVNLAAHLQLAVHPSDTVGSYNGVLCWSLEDVPE